jgi:hypothetical protein
MLIDLANLATLRAWLDERPLEHAAQLRALAALPAWARWRDAIRAALEAMP